MLLIAIDGEALGAAGMALEVSKISVVSSDGLIGFRLGPQVELCTQPNSATEES